MLTKVPTDATTDTTTDATTDTTTDTTTDATTDAILVVATKAQVSSDLGGEAVILHLQSGQYYGLNDVGFRIWQLIQAPKTIREIRAALLAEYDVDPEVCQRDLSLLLQQLSATGLVEVQTAIA